MISNRFILKIKKREVLIYSALTFYCSSLFFMGVTFSHDFSYFFKVLIILSTIITLSSFFDGGMSLKQWIIFLSIILLLAIDFWPSGQHALLYLFLIIWSCRNLDKIKAIRFIFYLNVFLVLLVFFLVITGIVSNVLYIQGDRQRLGLGFSWSVLPFYYINISLFWLYLKKRIYFRDVIFSISISFILFLFTDTKSGVIFVCLGSFLLFFVDNFAFIKKKLFRFSFFPFITLIPLFSFIISFILLLAYSVNLEFILIFDELITHRLYYTNYAFENYGISFLSNSSIFELYGNVDRYFTIDNSYMFFLFSFGLLGSAFIIFLYMFVLKQCLQRKDYRLLCIVLLYIFINFTWNKLHILIESEFLVLFSELFRNKTSFRLNKKCISKL